MFFLSQNSIFEGCIPGFTFLLIFHLLQQYNWKANDFIPQAAWFLWTQLNSSALNHCNFCSSHNPQTSTPLWLLVAAFHLACRLRMRNAQNFLFHPVRSSVSSLARPPEHNGCSWRRAGPILLLSPSDTSPPVLSQLPAAGGGCESESVLSISCSFVRQQGLVSQAGGGDGAQGSCGRRRRWP